MNYRWKEVVKLAFKGKPFEDHALDVNALSEVIRFKKLWQKQLKYFGVKPTARKGFQGILRTVQNFI